MSIPAQDHLGQKYKSLSAMARAWNIPVRNFIDRFCIRGWDLKKALTTPVNEYTGDCIPITYKGVTYKSLQNFADTFGMSRATVYGRWKYGWSPEEIIEVPVGKNIKKWRKEHGNQN